MATCKYKLVDAKGCAFGVTKAVSSETALEKFKVAHEATCYQTADWCYQPNNDTKSDTFFTLDPQYLTWTDDLKAVLV